jgi:putative ABC transport system permease protein
MFKLNLKIALRNLLKQKFYTVINILGLATGLTGCLLIALFIADEFKYDKFHSKADRIYRMATDFQVNGPEIKGGETPAPLARIMLSDFDEVEKSTRIFKSPQKTISYEEKFFNESKILAVDSNFFQLFDFNVVDGDKSTCLQKHNAIVITRDTEHRYFDAAPGLGKILIVDDEAYEVTAVLENVPAQSHFHFDILVPMTTIASSKDFDWGNNDFFTYVLLKPGADAVSFNNRLSVISEKYVGPLISDAFGMPYDEFVREGNRWRYFSQPLLEIHLHSALAQELEPNGNVVNVYLYSIIAFFILCIATVNFINLYTVRSTSRALEVGVRKAYGAINRNLTMQFVIEATIITAISTVFALVFSYFAVPYLNEVLGITILFGSVLNVFFVLGLFIFIVLVGFIAGGYPALYLTSFKPSEVLKGRLRSKAQSGGAKNKLVTFQFTVSIALIILSLLVREQINFMQTRSPGFTKDNVIVISHFDRLDESQKSFKESVSERTGVLSSSISSAIPALPPAFNYSGIIVRVDNEPEKDQVVLNIGADEDFATTFDLKLAAGRFFNPTASDDSSSVVLNETAVKMFGLNDAIGHTIMEGDQRRQVVGVVKDFNLESLKKKILPMVIYKTSSGGFMSVKVRPNDIYNTLESLKSKWSEVAPKYPFEYSFLDENLNNLYNSERRINIVMNSFTLLAAFIAAMGLLGLAAYTSEQRAKEIAVRKVIGASSLSVSLLLIKSIAKYVLVAFAISTPIAFWLISKWLEDFSNRVQISVWIFILPGVAALLLASILVGVQTLKVALSNPMKFLRS